MLHVILYQPEIPPNTGNVMRLCANTGSRLHLVRPLGFDIDDRRLRRAGLDYRDQACMQVHDSLEDCLSGLGDRRLFALSTRGRRCHAEIDWRAGDAVLFGPETRGLPDAVLADARIESVLRLPMVPGSRSLNLSNSVAVTVYEAWRQSGFRGSR
ncbi:MAG TPA: tRNA (cytidine(34)-2'-O)-methyltransferase [Gammaproteobacteria bacterium]|nr:tRNA (cytidine(34)-2'-O)-methyltransferase [Gammaproteobacteria bacterium]